MPGMPMHGKSKKLTGAQHQSSIKKTPKPSPPLLLLVRLIIKIFI
tara:strand:+ start:61 stop:195 length:135 start_codon:yes stop_codon:yes gene_type:complete